MADSNRSNLPWILAGCGALLVFGCCLSSAAGLFVYRQRAASDAEGEALARAAEQRRLAEAQQGGQGAPTLPAFVGTPGVNVQATVTRVVGRRLTIRPGDSCAFQVEYPERTAAPGERWCHTIVRCGGVALYGGGTGGYFPCTFSQSPAAVRGGDDETTRADGDGALRIDTAAGTLRVRDDSTGPNGTFLVEATITRAL